MKRASILVLLVSLFVLFGGKTVKAGSSWAVIDADTGRLLMGSNENLQLPIASLTKVWTAFTLLESGVPLGETTISSAAASAEGSSIYLEHGTKVDVESLLYGLMLRSGNDAAYALAEYGGGSLEGFVDLMNEKALYYGLNDTYFTNPSGLHDDRHLSTAYETALMMRYAMQNEKFKEIASTPMYTFKIGETTYSWANKHRLVRSTETAIAGKTGFTKAAGRTLVTYFEKDNKRVIVVTLNDGNDWNTHLSLAEKAFSTYRVETISKKGTYAILPGIEGELKKPIQMLLKKGEAKEISHILQIPRGEEKQSIGQWTVYFEREPVLSTEILLSR
ncbi:D-alanyl-D-alanine carboxypeptidase family protein [Sporosarcina pasteurii]|uniref:D-alanyl-D-alanine carboxypeptidase dacB n=1 Tax=Sporosarcina pasteurii TaxID=1474 RepID=A0A380BK50_SPOPA|nr:serine hydrolase [Sporosarcina pasteurii]MDS9470787.1 serine hydrolase [Sporosarcina pasteurii]QBQ05544.1 D-alanyl-D-alanine carboxypeptidase [Sporosarcina pasteurii]SUJ02300.1 D-alanyl-D-alanine carboxypeptidase dacB precursor [Sporosarcina pasteurii]